MRREAGTRRRAASVCGNGAAKARIRGWPRTTRGQHAIVGRWLRRGRCSLVGTDRHQLEVAGHLVRRMERACKVRDNLARVYIQSLDQPWPNRSRSVTFSAYYVQSLGKRLRSKAFVRKNREKTNRSTPQRFVFLAKPLGQTVWSSAMAVTMGQPRHRPDGVCVGSPPAAKTPKGVLVKKPWAPQWNGVETLVCQ